MKRSIYSIYDKQAEIFGQPFVAVNDTLALRAYNSLVQDPKSDLHKFPGDFKLMKLGVLDSITGVITPAVSHVISGESNLSAENQA